jgi:hypothetical protein
VMVGHAAPRARDARWPPNISNAVTVESRVDDDRHGPADPDPVQTLAGARGRPSLGSAGVPLRGGIGQCRRPAVALDQQSRNAEGLAQAAPGLQTAGMERHTLPPGTFALRHSRGAERGSRSQGRSERSSLQLRHNRLGATAARSNAPGGKSRRKH